MSFYHFPYFLNRWIKLISIFFSDLRIYVSIKGLKVLKKAISNIRLFKEFINLPISAKEEFIKDLRRGLMPDPGTEHAVRESIAWLCRAQDCSISKDGGVARHYSLITGWGASYPETTGYIIPTLIDFAEKHHDEAIIRRVQQMLDWLVKIQLPEGGFQGGTMDDKPVVPVIFNTGQILLGLSRGAAKFGEPYLEAMHKAADWLVNVQDSDGCWRKHSTPFAKPGEKAYETHVAWGLFEAASVGHEKKYANAAMRNINWALTKQHGNGWFSDCCLSEPSKPLTHTIGYVLRGVIEAYRFTKDTSLLHACEKTANGILKAIREDGFLPGRLNNDWSGTVRWSCLTGSAQIAQCYLMLYKETGKKEYLESGLALNRFVRRTVMVDGSPERRGGVKGSFPISGLYGKYEYLNWASKFFIDSNILEKTILEAE